MNLQTFFGEDEVSTVDGLFIRLLKLRKWLYFAAGLASLNVAGLLKAEAIGKLLGGIAVPSAIAVTTAVLGGFFLLTVQYFVLMLQVGTIYDIILKERTVDKRKSLIDTAQLELQQALEEVEGARADEAEARSNIIRATDDLENAIAQTKRLRESNKEVRGRDTVEASSRHKLNSAQEDLEQRKILLKINEDKVKSRKDFLEVLLAENPAGRQGFLLFERLMDGLRVFPPFAAAITVWTQLAFVAAAGPGL